MIHILLRYIGIKTKLLDEIHNQVDNILSDGDTILDLFSGSTIVGQSLSDKYNVFTNDIQKYSEVVGKATIKRPQNFDYSQLDYKKIIGSKFYKENNEFLIHAFADQIKYETELLNFIIASDYSLESLRRFKELYDNTPYSGHFPDSTHQIYTNVKEFYSKEHYVDLSKSDSFFYQLFTINYALPYFSINQAILIDNYRYSLDKMLASHLIEEYEYNVYMSMIIYYVQNIVTSIGDHFAQPQQFKITESKVYKKEVQKIIKKKTLDFENCMLEIQEQFNSLKKPKYTENEVFTLEHKELFDEKYSDYMNKVDLIYIDPPYTNAHYSRFYHILETLVKYDYPVINYKGRYRDDRYQSPFCIKSKANYEFDELIKACSGLKKTLLISYSDTDQCVLKKDELIGICRKYYKEIQVNEIDYLYRNFGQQPNKVNGKELLLICKM